MPGNLPSRIRSLLWKSFLLLGSGAVTSLFLSLISSPIISFNKEYLKSLFLILQLYNFALTFVKGGLENEIFALTLNSKKIIFRKSIIWGLIPSILICFSAALLIGENSIKIASSLLSLALFFDTMSIYYIAQLNAKGHYSTVAISNFINYPFFIFLLVIFAKNTDSLESFILLTGIFFALASFARFAYLIWKRKGLLNIGFTSSTQITPKISLVFSQCLNYVLFKSDIIIIAAFSGLEKYNFPWTDRLIYYIFLSQFVDIWSGVITSLSPLINKKYVPENQIFSLQNISSVKLISYLIIVIIFFLAYASFFYQNKIVLLPFDLIFLMIMRAALGLPVNLVSYSMVAQNLSISLVKSLSKSILVGSTFYFLFILYLFQTNINLLQYCIATIVPLQLFLFLMFKKPNQAIKNISL